MPYPKKIPGKDDYVWVRSVYGKGPDAKKRYGYIQNGGMNDVIKAWHAKQPQREKLVASPSSILTCPRVIWYYNHGIQPTNTMTWAVSQRLMLGRQLENLFAQQLKDEGLLLHHWADNFEGESQKFSMGEGLDRLEGTPDYLLQLYDKVAISDAKTSRSDSYGYVPLEAPEIWQDWGWYKYRLQLTAYFMLYNQKDFVLNGKIAPKAEICHLFSYALDDGVVRREVQWVPTEADKALVRKYTRRFNEAVNATEVPPCTCRESFENFDVKFCDFGKLEAGEKMAKECCSLDLLHTHDSDDAITVEADGWISA